MATLVRHNFYPSIMIVDDRDSMLAMLSYQMRRYGFIIYTAKTMQRAEAVAKEKRPHLIVMADALAEVSTLPLCTLLRQVKGMGAVPLILLATHASNEAIAELPAGVVTETIRLPLAPVAIVAQIRAVYRAHRPPFASELLVFGDLVMHLASCTVTKSGHAFNLSPIEFKILQCLMASPNRIIAREEILDYVSGDKKTSSHVRTIDVHIKHLRAALRKAEADSEGSTPTIIQTIRYVGYCLRQQHALDLRSDKEKK